ncbi:hypothetical protein F2Q69_00014113 [Brassica cretica]|uniref:Uncharacterized protein n=1 Tax=Brassica cretica TaxID=69181 RepID=A0A8S9QN55_BRACR|nr:hypothetical protein F2Q69_00014113 [Brassica cretica]
MCLAIYGVVKHLRWKKVGLDGFSESLFEVDSEEHVFSVEVEGKQGECKIEGLKLEVVRSWKKLRRQNSQLLFPMSHTMDSELNIVVDELGEAVVVRARHSPPP